ncbi:MAG: hypothetical protein AMXMBFR66_02220 [Pseudomonadota bacterium]
MGAFKDGVSVSFELINRSKRSIRLDLKSEAGRQIALALAERADVVIENFRPGVAARLGIGYEALRERRADIVYCSISGFGQTGPMAQFPSYDVIAQALSGLMSLTGKPDEDPVLVGESIGDSVSGLYGALGIALALLRRATTGEGARIDIAMFDALFSLLPTALAAWQVTGEAPGRAGNQHPLSAPFGAYAAADGPFMLAIANKALFSRFATLIGRPELARDPRFDSDQTRRQNQAPLRHVIEQWAHDKSTHAVVALLGEAGIPASPIWNVAQAATSGHATSRRLMTEVAHPKLGRLGLPEQPLHIAGLARGAARRAPDLGADGAEILGRLLGMAPDEVQRLADDGVI